MGGKADGQEQPLSVGRSLVDWMKPANSIEVMIFLALTFFAGVAVGALSYRNNAARAAKLEAKAKSIADEFQK